MRATLDSPAARRASNRFATLVLLTLAPSIAVLGWRALLALGAVLAVYLLLRRTMREPRLPQGAWPLTLPVDALLLCTLLPVEIAGGSFDDGLLGQRWPILIAAPLALLLLQRVREALPRWPFDPVVAALLLLHLLLGPAMTPAGSLQRRSLFAGDVIRAVEVTAVDPGPWYRRAEVKGEAALRTPHAAERLDDYLRGREVESENARVGANLDSLIRDSLPPLEDLALLGHPMPMGMTSGVLTLGVILWGAYRRTIDWRIPLTAIAAAYITTVLLPIPSSFGERGANWRFFAAAHVDVGAATGLTFAHYVLFSSPTLLALGLLAPRGDVRPLHSRAILVWSILLGVVCAACTLYVSVAVGPLVALLPAPVVARRLDRLLARRPLAVPRSVAADDPIAVA